MANKIKVVGYAKKEVFGNGIEYRNFSPDLVGNQLGAGEGTPIFTSGSFNISTNLDEKVNKKFNTNEFSNFISLSTLNLNETIKDIINKESKNLKLNLDYSDTLTYAFFGSLREYIRVSLENIIIKWPASLYIKEVDSNNPSLTGNTVSNYNYNPITDTATFSVDVNRIENNFNINFLSGGTIDNTYNESNALRNLSLNYLSYNVSSVSGNFPIINFLGASDLENSEITLVVSGNPFPNFSEVIENYHIKPNDNKIEEFFYKLNDFENNLLNRLTIPKFTSTFRVFNETDTGKIIESNKNITWPTTDGYNIDFNTVEYGNYVKELLEISEINDMSKSNLIVRFLVSSSISEFDTVSDIDNLYTNTNGQKMSNTLKIYGREFDELKKYSDGIKFANVVTYDKKNNTPDSLIKNLARVLGWELTSSISEIDILTNFLTLNSNYYEGYSRGYTNAESEIELWRRIILNTPWLWKSKGTRKAIEFLFKFIGIPEDLITFNEYTYVAKNVVDIDLVTRAMEYFNNSSDISNLNVDSEGFPKVFPNSPDTYFQKAGLWYRKTGGLDSEIDILSGNNPHSGPYDGGQEYIDQFTNCLVPNYVNNVGNNIQEVDETVNLFTNHNNGTFDECCDTNAYIDLKIDYNFQEILENNLNKIYEFYPISANQTGCTINNNWSVEVFLMGEKFHSFNIVTTGDTSITKEEYVNELLNISASTLSNTTLSGATYTVDENNLKIIVENNGCDSELITSYFKVELSLSSDFNCPDETIPNLTEFDVSQLRTDACTATSALPKIVKYYHDGSGSKPAFGDTVFTDINGLNVAHTPSGSTVFMGNDYTNPSDWLQTNQYGIREEIICPIKTCTVTTGTLQSTLGERGFYINGLTQSREVEIELSINNVQKLIENVTIEVTIFNGTENIVISHIMSDLRSVLITPNPNGNDYELKVVNIDINNVNMLAKFDINMTVNNLNGDCIDGTNIQTLNYSR